MRGWAASIGIGVVLASSALLLTSQTFAQVSPAEAPPVSESDDDDRLSTDALRGYLPDVEFAPRLPVLRVIPAVHVVLPYQAVGLGLTLEVVPVPWLRMGALYSVGVSPADQRAVVSHYGEALLGVRVFSHVGESAVNLPLREARPSWKHAAPELKAWVPAYHALFVEAGAMSGFTALSRCEGGCADATGAALPSDRRQLFMPMAGLRYVYAYEVRSERRNVRRRSLVQVYADVLGPPFVPPPSARFWPNSTSAGSPGFGGKVGVEVPPFGCLAAIVFGSGCLALDVSVGYAPYPRFGFLHVQAGYPLQ